MKKFILFISLVFIISACGGTTPEPTSTATPEPAATPIPEPAATPIPEPTATSIPEPTSTATPEPIVTDLIQLHYQSTTNHEEFEKKYLGKEITVSGPIKDAWFRYPLPPFYPLVLIGTKSAGSLDVLCIISKEKREDISKLKAGYDGTIKGTVSFIGYYQDERNNMHIDLEPCEIIFQEYVEQEYEEEHEESIDSSKLIEELIEKGKFKFILKRKGDISVKGFIETVDTNDIVRASKILLKGHDNYPNKINCNIGKTSPDFYEKIKTLNANDEVIVTGYLSGVSDEENIEIDDCGIN